MAVDYSLYLVTDSTKVLLGDKDLPTVVGEAIEGGVGIVQYRDKMSETAELVRMGKILHSITKKHNVPLLINDRIDIALAVGAEGVHLGQDDMDIFTARSLLGHDAIIGITCCTMDEAREATVAGASYLGIGTVFATPTKQNTKSIIGIRGTRAILEGLSTLEKAVDTVAIGGINATNVQRVIYQSTARGTSLGGVAIVSGIISAPDPRAAAAQLRGLIENPSAFAPGQGSNLRSVKDLLAKVPEVITEVSRQSPLCHNMTNLVVQNFAANVAHAVGGSPIMANYGEEAMDLAQNGGSLVVNMGTVTPDGIANYLLAVQAYNLQGGPVLFDPVGAGATRVRREAVTSLMNGGYFDVIKGNESEIRAVSGQIDHVQKGVDSSSGYSSDTDKARLVKDLASRERNIAVLTGSTDFLSDGDRIYSIANGHPYLSKITGSGCVLGTTIAAYLAANKEDKLLAVLAAMLVFEIAAERAAERSDVKGPGTFVPAFLDELFRITEETSGGNAEWLEAAKVEAVTLHS